MTTTIEQLRAEFPVSRPGLHVTDAIGCNIKATVLPALLAAGVEVRYSDATLLRFKMGKLWEAVLLKGAWRQQYKIGSLDDDSVGTVDGMLPHTWFPIEVTTTRSSILAPPSDAKMMQVQEYATRLMLAHHEDAPSWCGELRILHLNGDCGKNKCLEHGYPEEEVRRLNPDTNRQRLCCPVCQGWLFGEQAPEIRRIPIVWLRDDLLSLHKIVTWRLAELKALRDEYERHVLDLDLSEIRFLESPLPAWLWGYPKVECPGCEVRELVGCTGQEDTDQMEAEAKGSLSA